MVKQHLDDRIIFNLGHLPTPSQLAAVAEITGFLVSGSGMPMMLLKGYAGTGKTTLVGALVKAVSELGISTVLLAPTGRAAKVLGKESGHPAYTIHKIIYRQRSSKNGLGGFSINRNSFKNAIFIVDEASMISNEPSAGLFFGSGQLLDDLVSFVYQGFNCRLMLIGDPAQLPPVGFISSPALEAGFLEGYGATLFQASLVDVVRQQEDSGILKNATLLREALMNQNDFSYNMPAIETTGLNDVKLVAGSQLMEEIQWCYDNFGLEETLIICRSNKRANLFNKGIRESILFREEELSAGDFMLVMKNNYHWLNGHEHLNFIANGDIARVSRVTKYHSAHGYRFADVLCQLVDYTDVEISARLLLDTIHYPGAGFSHEEQQRFFSGVMNDYQEVVPKRKQYELVKKDDFYNALQVKFAYAMTCHKAQGGQWQAVFVDLGYFSRDHLSGEFYRWLYTAVTRATNRLYLVNFPAELLK